MSKRIVRRVVAGAPLACALACAVSCASQQTDQSSSLRADLVEVFPGVRAAPSGRYVELDARTTFFFDTFEEGDIFLEIIACSPDSREHETLVVCDARASNIHAALLLAGFEPGSPTVWAYEKGETIATPPTGDELAITFVYTDRDGKAQQRHPSYWMVHADTREHPEPAPFIFAGSRFVTRQSERRYDADFTGTLIGLAAFGSEVIAYPEPISPQASIDEPVWIADEQTVPVGNAPVVIRIESN